MGVLDPVGSWPVGAAAAAVVGPDGTVLDAYGPQDKVFPLASVTKPLVALSVLVAVEEGALGLDDPVGPPGSTVRHLLSHASGIAPDKDIAVAKPGTRRIYSNAGFDVLGSLLEARVGGAYVDVLTARVLEPLGMRATTLDGRPSQGLHGPLRDPVALARELLRPTLVRPETMALATTVAFPGLKGLLPGVGTFDPLDWGLGFELRDAKIPHWTGSRNTPGTFGHFGGSGTFIWVDAAIDGALVCLTDREYGPWALDAWPAFSDSVISARPVAYSP